MRPPAARGMRKHGIWPGLALAAVVAQALTAGGLLVAMEVQKTAHVAFALDGRGEPAAVWAAEDSEADIEMHVMLTWTVATVTRALDIGFDDWEGRVEAMRGRFTGDGFESYRAVLEKSLVLERLRKQRQVVSAVAQGAAVVTRVRKMGSGRFGYEVELPLLLTFYAGEGAQADVKLAARLLVVRVPRSERMSGLAIADFLLGRMGATGR